VVRFPVERRRLRPEGDTHTSLFAGISLKTVQILLDPTPIFGYTRRVSHLSESDGADGGKQVHYMLRWINTRGETGQWSATPSATIGA